MRTALPAPGAPSPTRRPAATAATVAGLGAAPALGGLAWAMFAWQIRRAKRAPRPYTDALPADGVVGALVDVAGSRPVRVAWLGDSLAAGLGCDEVDDTPARLVARMLGRPVDLSVLAVPGAKAIDVLEQQLPALGARNVDLVVICVGANDVVQLTHRSTYSRQLDEILAATASTPTVVLSLPDMAMPDRLAQPLRFLTGRRGRWFERARARVAAGHAHVRSVDVATRPPEISRRTGRRMLCADKFHPGPEAYRIWAERIADACHSALTAPDPSMAPQP